jgi:hypothetical protein
MWDRVSALVMLFYLCFFVLLASGRLSSMDAGAQLQAAMLLVNTGHLGSEKPPPGAEQAFCVKSPQGSLYEGHDIGNVVLMLPAAWLGSAVSKMPARALIAAPPIISRVGVALTCAVFCAFGCLIVYWTFALWYCQRSAFLLSLAFATATIYWPYAKTAWDVVGGCVAVILLLYFTLRLLSARQIRMRDAVLIGMSVALVGSFRYSLLPFVILGVMGCLYRSKRLTGRHWFACSASCLFLLLPTFIYNTVRMGTPFIPATRAAVYANNNDLDGSVVPGIYGLLFSPNRGLLVYAPVFVLLFFLPRIWKRIPRPAREVTLWYGLSAVFYSLMIAKMGNWGTFGWGPRYLVPILPVLYLPVGIGLLVLWERYKRPLILLVSLSVALNAAPVLVNWHLATSESPQAIDPRAPLPRQHLSTWKGLLLGLRGRPLPTPRGIMDDPIRSASARFPDLWTVRLMERSRVGLLAGLAISLLLLCGAGWSLKRLVADFSAVPTLTPRTPGCRLADGVGR